MKTITHSSPGIQFRDGAYLPMLTVYFKDGSAVNYVAAPAFANEDAQALADDWQRIVADLLAKYDHETPGGRLAIAAAIVREFSMTPDTEGGTP